MPFVESGGAGRGVGSEIERRSGLEAAITGAPIGILGCKGASSGIPRTSLEPSALAVALPWLVLDLSRGCHCRR